MVHAFVDTQLRATLADMCGITEAAEKAGLDPETFAKAVVRIKYPNDAKGYSESTSTPSCCMSKFKVRAEIDLPVAFAKLRIKQYATVKENANKPAAKDDLAQQTLKKAAEDTLKKFDSAHARGEWPPLDLSVDKWLNLEIFDIPRAVKDSDLTEKMNDYLKKGGKVYEDPQSADNPDFSPFWGFAGKGNSRDVTDKIIEFFRADPMDKEYQVSKPVVFLQRKDKLGIVWRFFRGLFTRMGWSRMVDCIQKMELKMLQEQEDAWRIKTDGMYRHGMYLCGNEKGLVEEFFTDLQLQDPVIVMDPPLVMDPDVLNSMKNNADLLQDMDQIELAKAYLKTVTEAREVALGPMRHETIAAKLDYALLLANYVEKKSKIGNAKNTKAYRKANGSLPLEGMNPAIESKKDGKPDGIVHPVKDPEGKKWRAMFHWSISWNMPCCFNALNAPVIFGEPVAGLEAAALRAFYAAQYKAGEAGALNENKRKDGPDGPEPEKMLREVWFWFRTAKGFKNAGTLTVAFHYAALLAELDILEDPAALEGQDEALYKEFGADALHRHLFGAPKPPVQSVQFPTGQTPLTAADINALPRGAEAVLREALKGCEDSNQKAATIAMASEALAFVQQRLARKIEKRFELAKDKDKERMGMLNLEPPKSKNENLTSIEVKLANLRFPVIFEKIRSSPLDVVNMYTKFGSELGLTAPPKAERYALETPDLITQGIHGMTPGYKPYVTENGVVRIDESRPHAFLEIHKALEVAGEKAGLLPDFKLIDERMDPFHPSQEKKDNKDPSRWIHSSKWKAQTLTAEDLEKGYTIASDNGMTGKIAEIDQIMFIRKLKIQLLGTKKLTLEKDANALIRKVRADETQPQEDMQSLLFRRSKFEQ
jgi:hypothetical protein